MKLGANIFLSQNYFILNNLDIIAIFRHSHLDVFNTPKNMYNLSQIKATY